VWSNFTIIIMAAIAHLLFASSFKLNDFLGVEKLISIEISF